ncbi:hypothetical protein SteCoe_28720 [Stentor coeruleus]|uniref:Uncharacterized protein n=1 Tax=Stentor coeruleus TaxID=5963 RepID=A0A1R2B7M9_9CILI|nr:hypothetical protein SteCoe_28720 [Stentor coeruleus]
MDSPYTSIKTYQEGLAYLENGISPYYSGSPVHAPPLLLYAYSNLSHTGVFCILAIVEIAAVFALMKLFKTKTPGAIFYLNPFSIYMILNLSLSILNCATTIFFIYYTSGRRRIKSAFVLSLLIYLDPSLAILSSFWYFQHFTFRMYLHSFFMILVLVLASFAISGSNWLESCQYAFFFMTDVQPSYGIRWYIMIEVFKRYNFLYSVMISMHIWVYVYPLHSILHKFHRYSGYDKIGELFVAISLAVCYINHPFPTFYEYGLVIAFFIPHYEIIKDVKSAYFTVNSWVIGSVLAASMWDMWINPTFFSSRHRYWLCCWATLSTCRKNKQT